MIQLEALGPLASYNFTGRFSPCVWKKKDDKGYEVRILKGYSQNMSGSRNISYAYFELDATGKITSCPRGLTKQFKGLTVADIDKKVEEYATKRVNEV